LQFLVSAEAQTSNWVVSGRLSTIYIEMASISNFAWGGRSMQ